MAKAIILNRTVTKTLVVNRKKPKEPQVFPNPGTAFWGKITGDMKNQADLKAELDEIRTLAYAGL